MANEDPDRAPSELSAAGEDPPGAAGAAEVAGDGDTAGRDVIANGGAGSAGRPRRPKPEKKQRRNRGGSAPAPARKPVRGLPFIVAGIALLAAATATGGTLAALGGGEPAAADSAAAPPSAPPGDPVNVAQGGQVAALERVVPPDVLAVGGGSISAAKVKQIGKLSRVQDVVAVAGGAVQLQGRQVNVLAVEPSSFRSWTSPETAKKTELWESLAADRFVVSPAAAEQLQLAEGTQYPVVGRTMPTLTMGGSGALGLPGIDMLVSEKSGTDLGLVPNVAVLVNAPGVDPDTAAGAVRKVLGPDTKVLNLHDGEHRRQADGGRPTSYMDLYKQAAATCPGLSWTILAAIGQVESSHGRNVGPSSAGALGPMQFMPPTWKAYGVDGDGDGKADIMNPYDAIPGAANYLCSTGAGKGGQHLYNAIWHYNHAHWYVRKVLDLAKAYEAQYG